jgi:hypothetical protein
VKDEAPSDACRSDGGIAEVIRDAKVYQGHRHDRRDVI